MIVDSLYSIHYDLQQPRQNKVHRCNLSIYRGGWHERYVGRLSVVLSRGHFVVAVVVRNDFELSSIAELMMMPHRQTSSMTTFGRDNCYYKFPPRACCCCHHNRIEIAVHPSSSPSLSRVVRQNESDGAVAGRWRPTSSVIVSLRVILNSVEIPGVRDPSESVAVSHFPLVVSLNRNYPAIAYTLLR